MPAAQLSDRASTDLHRLPSTPINALISCSSPLFGVVITHPLLDLSSRHRFLTPDFDDNLDLPAAVRIKCTPWNELVHVEA